MGDFLQITLQIKYDGKNLLREAAFFLKEKYIFP